MKLHGGPVCWRTRSDTCGPPHRFVDVQTQGPSSLWRHTHELESVGAGATVLRAPARYVLRFGPLGELALRVLVWRDLERIFDHRRDAVARMLFLNWNRQIGNETRGFLLERPWGCKVELHSSRTEGTRPMGLKKLGMVVVAALAVGAVFANSALAGKPVTRKASWTTGTITNANTIPEGTKEAIKCKKTAESPDFVFTSTAAGFPVKLTATGVECVEMTLFNVNEGGSSMAKGTGKLKFTGVSVVEPATCITPSTIQSNRLIADLQMDETVGAKAFVRLEPDAAAGVTNLVTLSLEECAAEGKYPVKGFTYCEATNATEVHATAQECNANATTTAFSSLTLGPNSATFTGEITTELSSGGFFGAEETETRKASWTTGTTPNANTIPTGKANAKAIKCRKTAASPNFTLTGTFGGSSVKLTATGVSCEATIYNEVVAGVPHAKATGKLKFTGVSVVEPAGCTLPAAVETNLLEGEVKMVGGGTKPLFKIEPDAAAGVVTFITLKIENCAIEGNYPAKGSTYCEGTNATEVHSETQECGTNAATAALSALTWFGSATFSGEITAELAAGGSFGAEEF